jgi:glycosyltransferase involved in cell wall biosynthesis
VAPAARPILLDVSRLVSRVGGGPATGIDRVERALLRAFLVRGVDLHGLCRTADGCALLPRSGLAALARRLSAEEPWGGPDPVGRLSLRLAPERRRAESDVRRFAIGRARHTGLTTLLAGKVAPGTAYLNVGHGNLGDPVFDALHAVPGSTSAVMLHDVIPLRLPWAQRPGTPQRFHQKLGAVARHAGIVLCPSATERAHVAEALAAFGRVPDIVVAPLGLDDLRPDRGALDPGGLPSAPYFVAVGTLEPRKNVSLLLDLWEHFSRDRPASAVPGLCLIGRRGWEEERVLRRLDALKARIPAIREYPALSDGARSAIVAGARGLLFPSLAEGYGLPPLEALALGVTPVCAPLPVYRETMGDAAVYADPADLYQWADIVDALATGTSKARPSWNPPTWDDFVNTVLATIA